MKEIELVGLDKKVYTEKLNNGLEIYLIPYNNKKNYYISYATRYGSDINCFKANDKEYYSFDDVCDLVKEKLSESKSRESDELFNYIVNNKNNKSENNRMTKKQLQNAFEENEIHLEPNEIDEMLEYMNKEEGFEEEENEEEEEDDVKNRKYNDVGRSEFKKFFVKQK